MAARAVAEFGGIDILMTAAGVLSFGSATETDPTRGTGSSAST